MAVRKRDSRGHSQAGRTRREASGTLAIRGSGLIDRESESSSIMKKHFIAGSVLVTLVLAAVVIFATEEEKKTTESASTSGAEHQVMKPADLKWGEMPPGLPAGAKMAVLNGDPTKPGPFTVRMDARSGYTIKPHMHPTAERVTVISGTFKIGMGEQMNEASMEELGPGGYVVLPANMGHYAMCPADCIVQIDSEGPFQITYFNAVDDPRNSSK